MKANVKRIKGLAPSAVELLHFLKTCTPNEDNEGILITNKEIRGALGNTIRTIVNNIQSLEREGYISLEYETPRIRIIRILK